MKEYESVYSITGIKGDTMRIFEDNRKRLGLSADMYIRQLLHNDYTGVAILKKVDLNQTRLYHDAALKPDKVEK